MASKLVTDRQKSSEVVLNAIEHQGGALQFINAMGAQRFVERSRELAQRHGARFEPAAVVVKMAQDGARFEDA